MVSDQWCHRARYILLFLILMLPKYIATEVSEVSNFALVHMLLCIVRLKNKVDHL
jgi:hypothetical protein